MEIHDDDLIKFEAEGAIPLPSTRAQGAIEHDGAQIWYATYGSGSPVILLHGGLGHSSADVYVEAVRIFTAPVPVTSPFTWEVPGDNYRGQGIGVRYTNGTQFSAISEAHPYPDDLVATPSSLYFLTDPTGQSSPCPRVTALPYQNLGWMKFIECIAPGRFTNNQAA